VLQSPADRLAALREYFPKAQLDDWELEVAGQRVQVIKKDSKKLGVLQFGTEVVAAADGSVAGLLGASPGASTAVPIMFQVIEKCFPDRVEAWMPRLRQMVPSYGTQLSDDPKLAASTLKQTAQALGINA
jgi:malate dehydrogenase (quinone)